MCAWHATQVVDMSAALASLGYTPSAETARSIARASVDTHTSADTQTEGLAAADLVSVLWTQVCVAQRIYPTYAPACMHGAAAGS